FARHGLCTTESKNCVVAVLLFEQLVNVDARRIVEPAITLRYAGDLVTAFLHEARGVRTHVAKALNDDAATVNRHVEVAQALIAGHLDPAARSLNAALRATDVQRLAGDNAGNCLSHVHGVGVHDPCHRLLVGIHVGGGNVLFRPNKLDNLRSVAARHAFQLAAAHGFRIADDTTFGSPKGNIHDCTLPRHPARQCSHFIESHIGRVADTSLAWTARHGVLYAKSSKHVDHAVIESYGKMNDHLARRRAQHLPKPLVEIQLARGKIEARALCFPGVDLLVQRHGGSFSCHTSIPTFS